MASLHKKIHDESPANIDLNLYNIAKVALHNMVQQTIVRLMFVSASIAASFKVHQKVECCFLVKRSTLKMMN